MPATDADYLGWLASHPDGYVLTVRARLDPDYAVLHTAQCWTISRSSARAADPFTSRSYRKVVADDVASLRGWISRNLRRDGAFSKLCGHCRPRRARQDSSP